MFNHSIQLLYARLRFSSIPCLNMFNVYSFYRVPHRVKYKLVSRLLLPSLKIREEKDGVIMGFFCLCSCFHGKRREERKFWRIEGFSPLLRSQVKKISHFPPKFPNYSFTFDLSLTKNPRAHKRNSTLLSSSSCPLLKNLFKFLQLMFLYYFLIPPKWIEQ